MNLNNFFYFFAGAVLVFILFYLFRTETTEVIVDNKKYEKEFKQLSNKTDILNQKLIKNQNKLKEYEEEIISLIKNQNKLIKTTEKILSQKISPNNNQDYQSQTTEKIIPNFVDVNTMPKDENIDIELKYFGNLNDDLEIYENYNLSSEVETNVKTFLNDNNIGVSLDPIICSIEYCKMSFVDNDQEFKQNEFILSSQKIFGEGSTEMKFDYSEEGKTVIFISRDGFSFPEI